MTQRDRDRLVVLKKAQKKLIKQSQAAQELGISVRQVKRLLRGLREKGDKAVIHGLRGRESKRKTTPEQREKIIGFLSQEVYRDFGPTLASEYLRAKRRIRIGRETLRKLMVEAGLWRVRRQKEGAPVATTAELPGRTGAMGHQRTRLAGRTGREAVPDSHDRRCDPRGTPKTGQ